MGGAGRKHERVIRGVGRFDAQHLLPAVGLLSDMPLLLSIHGFQITVLLDPVFSITMRRFHNGLKTVQAAPVCKCT